LKKLHNQSYTIESVKDNLKTFYLSYIILLSSISVLEVSMILRSLIAKNITENVTHLAYFVSYVTLLFFSLLTLTALITNRKTGEYENLVYSLVNVYGFVILLWSAAVSYLDVTKGNTMIVFMTIIVCVAAVLNMHPVLYTSLVVPMSVLLIVAAKIEQSPLLKSRGYYFNFAVFVLFSLILAFVQRRTAVKTYRTKKKLEDLSFRDQLTGTYNRYSLREHANLFKNDGSSFIGIVDLDDFKNINDRFGHDVGDTCLIMTADLLSHSFGEYVYRFGGDEFIIVTDKKPIQIEAEIKVINETLDHGYEGCGLHISAGFTPLCGEDKEFADAFKLADHALYRAKDEGKSRVCFSEPRK